MNELALREKEKYERAWAVPEYSDFSPGAEMVANFLDIVRPWKNFRVIDFGCGSGAASVKLADLGFHVTGIDHVDVRKEEGKDKYRFIQCNLWEPIDDDLRAEYGFCVDVMEHIPEDKVGDVLENILCRVRHCFLSISFVEDGFGDHPDINERLHLTVKPYSWWKAKLASYGYVISGRDMRHSGVFHVRPGGKEMLTITREEAVENLEYNLKLSLPQVIGYQPNERPTLLLAGGPSLNDHVEEIQQKRKDGAALITCNGSHDWALDHDMIPSLHFQADGRQFNERFLRRPQLSCKYLIASTCHPDLFKNLGHTLDPTPETVVYQAEIWHSDIYPETIDPILTRHYLGKNYAYITGGSTVATRALSILQVLGFRSVEAYGLDGCYGSDHAYSQPENANEAVCDVTVAGRTFQCSGWQIAQAQHFIDNVKGGSFKDISLTVHGDGLIAWIIEAGSKEENIEFVKSKED
jgi:SAM-dependent methyltransferase